jgi:hypothetical protein
VHGGRSGGRAGAIAGPCCTGRWSRGMVTCPLPTYRLAKSSHSLIMSTFGWRNVHGLLFERSGCVACSESPRARAVVVPVLVGLFTGQRGASRGTSGCIGWSKKCFRRYNWSPPLAAGLDRLDEAPASSGRNSLLHCFLCAVIWPHCATRTRPPSLLLI